MVRLVAVFLRRRLSGRPRADPFEIFFFWQKRTIAVLWFGETIWMWRRKLGPMVAGNWRNVGFGNTQNPKNKKLAKGKLKDAPRTHKICDIKNFGTKFWSNLTILVFLESWDRDLSKFGKTKLRRDPNFVKIEIWGLGLRIQNLNLS